MVKISNRSSDLLNRGYCPVLNRVADLEEEKFEDDQLVRLAAIIAVMAQAQRDCQPYTYQSRDLPTGSRGYLMVIAQ